MSAVHSVQSKTCARSTDLIPLCGCFDMSFGLLHALTASEMFEKCALSVGSVNGR